jgi:hypothetical protein
MLPPEWRGLDARAIYAEMGIDFDSIVESLDNGVDLSEDADADIRQHMTQTGQATSGLDLSQ